MNRIIRYIFNRPKCHHNNILPTDNGKYCPDCGKKIILKWFVVRCSCCNVRKISFLNNDKIMPTEKHCTNCGNTDYIIEELINPSYFELRYAVAKKESVGTESKLDKRIQIWVEENKTKKQAKQPALIPIIQNFA